MSRHQPVSPFERASFHRRGSAGWDLSGIQAVAPVVAQPNFQPLVAQPIGLAPSAYSAVLGEDTMGLAPAKRVYLGPGLHALWTPKGDGELLHRMWDSLEGPSLDFVGYTDVEGVPTGVFRAWASGTLWIIDEGTRVFGIDPKVRLRERP